MEPCEWREDDGGAWWTACGEGFEFNDGGPEENGARFCMYCGELIRVVPLPAPAEAAP